MSQSGAIPLLLFFLVPHAATRPLAASGFTGRSPLHEAEAALLTATQLEALRHPVNHLPSAPLHLELPLKHSASPSPSPLPATAPQPQHITLLQTGWTSAPSPLPATTPQPQHITLLQTGGTSAALLPTPAPFFDILTAQPIPPRGGWETYPPEPVTPLAFPEPPPAPVPLFSLQLVELAVGSLDMLRLTPCAHLPEGLVLAVGMGGPSEEYARVASANCTQLQRLDGGVTGSLEVRLQAPLRFEHGDGESADAMPALFQIPTHRLHARWEPPPAPEYLRAVALANRAVEWIASHASRSPQRWAPRDIALALSIGLLGLSTAMLLLSCCLMGARRLARAWLALRRAEQQAPHLHQASVAKS